MPIESLTTPPVVGRAYLVPCARHLVTELLVPVLGPPHQDPELQADFDHVHPDLRFCTDLDVFLWVAYHPCLSELAVRLPAAEQASLLVANLVFAVGTVRDFGLRTFVCQRETPEPRVTLPGLADLEAKYAGASLINGRCPHRGTPLLSEPLREGRRICPAHGLCFDQEGRQCPRKP